MLLDLVHRTLRSRYQSLGFVSKTLKFSSGTLHYLVRERQDAKETLVLVHGLGTSSNTWSLVMPHIAPSYRVIALDLPGFGFSTVDHERGYCTLHEHREALSALMTMCLEPPVILLGHSFGGWVSCLYAASAPETVRHAILVDAAGVYYEGAERLRDLFTLRSVRDARRLVDELWYSYPWYFRPFAGSIYNELKARRMNEIVASIGRSDVLSDELSRLTMPVTIIWGENDAVIPVECAYALRAAIPHARIHILPRCGHVPQLERPKEFAALLQKVLER